MPRSGKGHLVVCYQLKALLEATMFLKNAGMQVKGTHLTYRSKNSTSMTDMQLPSWSTEKLWDIYREKFLKFSTTFRKTMVLYVGNVY